MLTLDRLKSVINYNPLTGLFTWMVNTKRIRKGFTAGHIHSSGYVRIAIDGTIYRAHRLAWFYMTGASPSAHVDHINRIRSDNRWENLRLATSSQNSCNSSIRSKNSSGVKGVHWSKQKDKWEAQITVKGEKLFIGSFVDLELAKLAIDAAREKFHGTYASDGL